MLRTTGLLIAVLLLGCSSPRQRQVQDFKAVLPPGLVTAETPPTARSFEPFRKITSSMTMAEVIALCGVPDLDVGSGIHVFIYRLSDGSSVVVGTPDCKRLLYATHNRSIW